MPWGHLRRGQITLDESKSRSLRYEPQESPSFGMGSVSKFSIVNGLPLRGAYRPFISFLTLSIFGKEPDALKKRGEKKKGKVKLWFNSIMDLGSPLPWQGTRGNHQWP